MNYAVVLPIVVSVMAVIPGLYALIKAIKKDSLDRSDMVFQSAITLIEANRKQAEENEKQVEFLSRQLNAARQTIDDISQKLIAANMRADRLTADLSDANLEISSLRAQIKTMSKQVGNDE